MIFGFEVRTGVFRNFVEFEDGSRNYDLKAEKYNLTADSNIVEYYNNYFYRRAPFKDIKYTRKIIENGDNDVYNDYVEIPLLYYKTEKNFVNGFTFRFSTEKIDGFKPHPAYRIKNVSKDSIFYNKFATSILIMSQHSKVVSTANAGVVLTNMRNTSLEDFRDTLSYYESVAKRTGDKENVDTTVLSSQVSVLDIDVTMLIYMLFSIYLGTPNINGIIKEPIINLSEEPNLNFPDGSVGNRLKTDMITVGVNRYVGNMSIFGINNFYNLYQSIYSNFRAILGYVENGNITGSIYHYYDRENYRYEKLSIDNIPLCSNQSWPNKFQIPDKYDHLLLPSNNGFDYPMHGACWTARGNDNYSPFVTGAKYNSTSYGLYNFQFGEDVNYFTTRIYSNSRHIDEDLPIPDIKKDGFGIRINNLEYYTKLTLYKNGVVYKEFREEYITITEEGLYYIIGENSDENFNQTVSEKSIELSFGNVFSIELYQNDSESNRVDKTSFLDNRGVLYGVLRKSSSIVNPIITIESLDIPKFNYVRIPIFNRCYYVTDIISIRNNVWEVSLKVDVLMSNKDNILLQKGIISRNEYEYEDFIVDDRIYSEDKFETTILTSNVGRVSIGGWNEEKQEEITTTIGDDFSYVFCVMTGLQYYSTPVIDGQANIVDNRVPYFVSKEDYGKIIAKILVPDFFETVGNLFDSASNYIISNYIIPFNMYDLNIEQNGSIASPLLDRLYPTNIFCRNIDLGYSGLLIDKGARAKVTFTFNKGLEINDFTDNTPFSRYFINLPFYGIVEIDSTQIGNLNRIIYDLDVSTGDFICKIGETYEYVGNMYIELPLGSTNTVDIYRNVVETGISLVGSLITNGVSNHFNISNATAMRTPKTNKLSKKGKKALRGAEQDIVQDVANISTGALGDFISSIIPSGSCDSTIGRYISFKRNISQVEIYKIKPKYFYPEDYNHYNGRPLVKLRQLNDVHGYTEVSQIHLENFTCTGNEISEIEDYLIMGVILP